VEFLTRVRTEHAKALLQHSSLKFYEIASKVGYADPNYFSLLFKKVTGMTPKEYREKQTKEIAT
jgi:two-component system response regulator YesN